MHGHNERNFPQAKSEINVRFLLNENGDLYFLLHNNSVRDNYYYYYYYYYYLFQYINAQLALHLEKLIVSSSDDITSRHAATGKI